MDWKNGWLGKIGEKMEGDRVQCSIIKCAACSFGKQGRTSKEGTTIVKDKEREGILTKDKLDPGSLVFTDQFESRLPCRVFTSRGSQVSSQKYKGGTLFCDAASSKVSIYMQSSFTVEETIQSKLKYEKECQAEGVVVSSYSSDNGVYAAKDYMSELLEKGQGIRRSGVGGHHHNGKAENAIRTVTRLARSMMIHAALRWPAQADKDLWPLALQHAAHLYNNLPDTSSGMTPNEIWLRTKSNYSAIHHAHT